MDKNKFFRYFLTLFKDGYRRSQVIDTVNRWRCKHGLSFDTYHCIVTVVMDTYEIYQEEVV